MTDFIKVYENIASDDYCDRMIQMHNELSAQGSASRGEDNIRGLQGRKDYSWYFDREEIPKKVGLVAETNAILDNALKLYINEFPSFGMQACHSFTVKVQKTPPKGGFHVWHCEHAVENGSAFRTLVWTVYLNDIPEGEGETEFLEFGRKITPKKGSVCIFPASWTHTHRGNTVYTCDKYIATGWYYLS